MKKILPGIVIAIAFLAIVLYALNTFIYNEKQADIAVNYKDAEYRIDGSLVRLKDGVAEVEVVPGSASKVLTRYFGNDYVTDLDNDGRDDVVFLLTQETGGSGIFYYAVAALNTERGYVGSDGYLLGDRVAPQSIEMSSKPRHKNVVAVNYADRGMGEPMTAQPSVGKSAYLKLDVPSMQ